MQPDKKTAIQNRDKRYFGKVCEKHQDLNGLRLTSTRTCVGCNRDHARKWAQEHKQSVYLAHKKHRLNNREKHNERSKAWRAANKDKVNALRRLAYIERKEIILKACKEYNQKNREERLKKQKEYQKKNLVKFRIAGMKRLTKKKQASPKWANTEKVNQFYFEANEMTLKTGIDHQVDHIIPINHKLVCGLHCEFNLQVLTKEENKKKSNKYCILQAAEAVK